MENHFKSTSILGKIFGILLCTLIAFQVAAQQHLIDSLKLELNKELPDSSRYKVMDDLGWYYKYISPDSGIHYAEKGLRLATKIGSLKWMATANNTIGTNYLAKGELDKSIEYRLMALALADSAKDTKGVASAYNNLSIAYVRKGDFNKALQFVQKSITLYEQLKDSLNLAIAYTTAAGIQADAERDEQTHIEYIKKALSIFTALGHQRGMAQCYMNLGDHYNDIKEFEKSREFLTKSLELHKSLEDKLNESRIYTKLAFLQADLGHLDSAKLFYNNSLLLAKELGEKAQQAIALGGLAEIAIRQNLPLKAIPLAKEAYEIATEIGEPTKMLPNLEKLHRAFSLAGKHKQAYEAQKLYFETKDSLYSEEKSQEFARLESEFALQRQKDSLNFVQEKERLSFQEEVKRRDATQNASNVALAISALLLVSLLYFFYDKQKSNRKLSGVNLELANANEELQTANEEIRTSQEETLTLNESLQQTLFLVQHQKQEITDSIAYAQKIQQAILPPIPKIQAAFPECFVMFRPRDVVSGDFYWFADMRDTHGELLLAAIDCTGHGVPGAFMSMVGNDLLNHTIHNRQLTDPGEILSQLHLEIRKALNQGETNNRDGMDMALISWNPVTKTLKFAGAKNPLIYVQNGELFLYKGDKSAIGGEQQEKERIFTTHQFTIDQPTVCYLFSDGFQDQFGGPNNKKYMVKRLREFLLQNSPLLLAEQHQNLATEFEDWKGKEEQVDDVLVIGVKLV